MKILAIAICAVMIGGCGGDDVCDPTGIFTVRVDRLSGDCSDNIVNQTLVISRVGDVFQMVDADGIVYTGIVELSPGCSLDVNATDRDPALDITADIRYQFEVDEEAQRIAGTVMIVVVDRTGIPPDVSCTSDYTVTSI